MTEGEIIKQRTADVLKSFLWEMNTHETRSAIAGQLQNVLFYNEGIEYMQVIDRTHDEDIDAGKFVFVFLDKNTGIEHTLESYINSLKVTADGE
jgi:hypothetical protein